MRRRDFLKCMSIAMVPGCGPMVPNSIFNGCDPMLPVGTGAAVSINFTNKVSIYPSTNGGSGTQSTTGLANFDAWFGQPADFIVAFSYPDTWTDYLAEINSTITLYSADNRPKVWAVGLNVTGTTLDDAALGTFNSHYLSAAQAIIADAAKWSGPVIIRVGHEFNVAGTYPWDVVTANKWTQYVSAFQQFVNTFRSVSNRFKFCWNPNIQSIPDGSVDITQAYPGDTYVDVIGLDYYYDAKTANPDPVASFGFFRDIATSGLAWQVAFAASHGKKLALPEWGTSWDNPEWIDEIYSWTSSNGYAWTGYWDNTLGFSSQLSDNSYPQSGRRFIADFKNGAAIPSTIYSFALGPGGWQAAGTGQFSVLGTGRVERVTDFSGCAQYTLTGLVNGTTYTVNLNVNTGGGQAQIRVEDGVSFANLGIITPTTSVSTAESFTFVASAATAYMQITPFAGDTNQVVTFDTVTLNGTLLPVYNFAPTGSGHYAVINASAKVTGVSDFSGCAQVSMSGLTIGRTYTVIADVNTGGKTAQVRVEDNTSFAVLGSITPTTSSLTPETFTFTAASTAATLQITPFAGDNTQVVTFDYVEIY